MGVLDGRVAVVTGGGRGIGVGICTVLAQHGAAVAVNYSRSADGANEVCAAITAAGGTARAYKAAIDNYEESAAMAERIVADFGHIDILVNNAGVASRGKTVAETDAEEVQRLLAIHAIGPHQLCRAVLPSMRTRERGDIVFISSVATANNLAKGAPYNMAKAAMESLAYTLAKEERQHGIHVNIAAPGLVETDMGVRLARSLTSNKDLEHLRSLDASSPFGRVCQPEDVANVVLWFCSPGASYVTGQRVQCDGGGAIASY